MSETKKVGQVEIEDAGTAQKATDHLKRTELETLTVYVESGGFVVVARNGSFNPSNAIGISASFNNE